VGEGREVLGREAGLIREKPRRFSISAVLRIAPRPAQGRVIAAASRRSGRKSGTVLTRRAISGASFPRYASARAMAVVEYRNRRSDDQIEPQHG